MAAPNVLRLRVLEEILYSKTDLRISQEMKASGSRRVEGGERSKHAK